MCVNDLGPNKNPQIESKPDEKFVNNNCAMVAEIPKKTGTFGNHQRTQ